MEATTELAKTVTHQYDVTSQEGQEKYRLLESVFCNNVLKSAPPITIIAMDKAGVEGLATNVDLTYFDRCKHLDDVLESVQNFMQDVSVFIRVENSSGGPTLEEFANGSVLCVFDKNTTDLKAKHFSVKSWMESIREQETDLESAIKFFELWSNLHIKSNAGDLENRDMYVVNKYKDELVLCFIGTVYAYLTVNGIKFSGRLDSLLGFNQGKI